MYMNGIVLDVNNIGHSSSSRLKACRGGIAVVMRLTNVSAAPRAHGDTTQKRPGLYVYRGVAAWNRDRGLRRWFTPPTTSSTRVAPHVLLRRDTEHPR